MLWLLIIALLTCIFIILIYLFVCVYMHVYCRAWRDILMEIRRTPSILWVLGIKLRSSDLVASAFNPLRHLAGPSFFWFPVDCSEDHSPKAPHLHLSKLYPSESLLVLILAAGMSLKLLLLPTGPPVGWLLLLSGLVSFETYPSSLFSSHTLFLNISNRFSLFLLVASALAFS